MNQYYWVFDRRTNRLRHAHYTQTEAETLCRAHHPNLLHLNIGEAIAAYGNQQLDYNQMLTEVKQTVTNMMLGIPDLDVFLQDADNPTPIKMGNPIKRN